MLTTGFFIVWSAATLLFLGWRFWFFLRNPERRPPPGNGFLSPADGYVVYVKRVEKGEIPISIKQRKTIPLEEITAYPSFSQNSGYLIGVYMTAFSVHHNRTPLSGSVVEVLRRRPARNNTMARMMTNLLTGNQPYEENCDYIVENERVTMIVDTAGGRYALTQIADKWISHVVNECAPGLHLERGERFGLIRFGSQVDVFLPDELGYVPVARTGEYVYAGVSILATNTLEP